MTYQFLDSGNGQKLERFGEVVLIRLAPSALWRPTLPKEEWDKADASFSRKMGNRWAFRKKLPTSWIVTSGGLRFKIALTDFGHVGLFPEHFNQCQWMTKRIKEERAKPSILNLFAYSGAVTLFAAKAGAKVCHVDASKGMVSWARENATLNKLEKSPIRWIVDDVFKFLQREERRRVRYDGIILDPPSFGRGSKGEIFKLERDLVTLLERCRAALSRDPLFVILSTHTPGITPIALRNLLSQMMRPFSGKIEQGEMVLGAHPLPNGSFVRWRR